MLKHKDGGQIDYVCCQCGARDCKLWREYQTFLNHQNLYCALCAGKDQKKDVSSLDESGRMEWMHGMRTDQIGWLVPAVPTLDHSTFWGYTSVPEERVQWWRALPTFPKEVVHGP